MDGAVLLYAVISPPRFMKAVLRRALASTPLIRRSMRRLLGHGEVTVLMYHTLSDDGYGISAWTAVRRSSFLQQMEWLRQHYDIVSVSEAMDDSCRGGGRPRAVLTFDDGESGLHRVLLPVIERERLPVTIYVATGQIESGQAYWFDRLINAAQVAESVTLALPGTGSFRLEPHDEERAWRLLSAVLTHLKTLECEKREALTSYLVSELAKGPSRRVKPLRPMSREELAELSASPWVTIGAHTHGHELLDQISTDAARGTIETSRDLLKDWTGRPVEHFAYPNGNHNRQLMEMVHDLGFLSGMSTRHGLWVDQANRFSIPRIPVGRYDDLDRFKLALLGGPANVLKAL